MKTEQIAVQLYTLRDFTQTPADFAATMHRVREIGFHAVELAGTAGLPPDEATGAMLRRAGMTLCYHNHAHEFFQCNGGTVLDDLFARTSPEHLQAELDIHWVQAGGGDPAEACRRLSGRLPLLHVKDYTVTAQGDRQFAEVGHGNLNIPEILAAAEAAGCQWFIVEQDTCPGDPFECIARSFDYLKGLCD